jgi:transcriptional regulator with XRE-family HTH domain
MSRENLFHDERLKKVRQDHLRLTQQKLAEAIGVPVYRIKDIENGKIRMSPEVALLLEEKFNLDFRWLLTGEGTMTTEVSSSPSPKPRNVDSRALQGIIEMVEERATQAGITLGAAKKARLIVLLWEYSVETGKGIEPEMVDKYLELVV